jgi:hypothetical protein
MIAAAATPFHSHAKRERLWAKLKFGLKVLFFVGATLVSLAGVAELVIKANQLQVSRTHQ